MKKTLTLLVASTALTAAIGFPAWSAIRAAEDGTYASFTALLEDGKHAMPLFLASDDDDDDDRHDARDSRHDDHDHDDDDDDDDDECDDDDDCAGAAANPAPAGSVAPPANGLFGNGTPPKVQMN